jgi:hypothetical protein
MLQLSLTLGLSDEGRGHVEEGEVEQLAQGVEHVD